MQNDDKTRYCEAGEIGVRREARARALVGNQAGTATRHGGHSRPCFEIFGPEH